MKVPLIIPNESRDIVRDKDSWGINCFLEREDADRAVKRPGLINTVDGLGTVGQGVFIWPTIPEIVVVVDDQLHIVVNSVHIGDIVSGYYAMVDDPSTTPGPGDPYWSPTPPGSDRFRGYWYGSHSGDAIATSPTTPNYLIGDIAASADAAAKVWVKKVVGPNASGVAVLNKDPDWSPDVVGTSIVFNSPTVYTYPFGYAPSGRIGMNINGKNDFLSPPYPGGWPSGVSWTTPTTFNGAVGAVRKRRTTSSFTVTSSGTTATITSGVLYGPYQLIEISGCNEPEYNGIFYAVQQLNPTYPWLSALEWKFTLPGIPAASPATGTKVLTYYGVL